jgi:hypothetical protein
VSGSRAERWLLTLSNRDLCGVNRVISVFGLERLEVTGDLRKAHNEGPHNL